MSPRPDPPRRHVAAVPDRGSRRGLAARPFRRVLVLAFAAASLSSALCSTATGGQVTAKPAAGDSPQPDAIGTSGILPRIDAVLAALDSRIEDIRMQADEMLDHADAAIDSDEQMRFEEMYGKLAAAAEKLEEERDRLRSMRDELAAVGEGKR